MFIKIIKKIMRTLILLIIAQIFGSQLTANKINSDYNLLHLYEVNAQWTHQPERNQIISTANLQATTYKEWIALHLQLVEQTLRNRNTNHLSINQINNRSKVLDNLHQYWQQGVFPVNDYLGYKNPVFIDRAGTHCAVGYLMQQNGAEALAQQINSTQKFAYIHQIKLLEVNQWAAQNGFTIDELAWIQPGYPPANLAYDMEKGLNGTVHSLALDSASQTIYAAGAFTQSIKGNACQNIAAYISGFAGYDWISVGNGVNGTVHTLLVRGTKLYVGGEFTQASGLAANHVAVYDIVTGLWQAMGTLDNTVRALTFYNNELYAGGDFTGYVSKWNGTQWQDITQGFIQGAGVRTLEVYNNELVIGGSFNLTTGAQRQHVAIYNGTQMSTMGLGTISPVNDFTVHKSKLYAACDITTANAISVFNTTGWQVELLPVSNQLGDIFNGTSVRQIKSNGTYLLAAGDFICSWGMSYGANFMEYERTINGADTLYHCSPMLLTDAEINTFLPQGNTIYFGGAFVNNNFGDSLNRVGYFELQTTSIPHIKIAEFGLKLSPNPAGAHTVIQTTNNTVLNLIELFDLNGKKLLQQNVNSTSAQIELKNLPGGVYTIHATTKEGSGNIRLVKE